MLRKTTFLHGRNYLCTLLGTQATALDPCRTRSETTRDRLTPTYDGRSGCEPARPTSAQLSKILLAPRGYFGPTWPGPARPRMTTQTFRDPSQTFKDPSQRDP